MARRPDLAAALAVLLGAGTLLPAAAPLRAAETRILSSNDCIKVPRTSHSPPELDLCGFSGLAMNPAGDRLLTVTVRGRVQLWSARGAPLADLGATASHNDQLMFAGDRALFLDGVGNLVMLDGRTGAELARFPGLPNHGRLDRALGDLVMVSDGVPDQWPKRETVIVSLRDGAVATRSMTGEPPRYRTGAAWAAGVSTHRDGGGEWRATLHLADSALTRVPLDRPCEPIGPRRQCASTHRDGAAADVFDLATRRWTRYDLGVVERTTMVEWAQAGGRLFAMVCDLQPLGPGWHSESGYACRIVDPVAGRTLHRFDAAKFVLAGGVGPGGTPELRLAARPKEGPLYILSRIGLDGKVEPVGRFDSPTRYSIDGPGGLLWTRDGREPGMLVARSGAGRARMDARFGECAQQPATWLPHTCRVSRDLRRIAALDDDGLARRIFWGTIEWRRDAGRRAGKPRR